jgi:hypothetical protein
VVEVVGGAVVLGGAVVDVGGSVVVGGPRRGRGPVGGPDCDSSCGGAVTGTVVGGATAGAGAGASVVVVVESSSVVLVVGCAAVAGTTTTGAATGATAAVVEGVSSAFAGTPRGRSDDASNATSPATNARQISDSVVVATWARPTRWRPVRRGRAATGMAAAVRSSNQAVVARGANEGSGATGSTGALHSGHRARAPLIGDPHVPQYCVTARSAAVVERLTG